MENDNVEKESLPEEVRLLNNNQCHGAGPSTSSGTNSNTDSGIQDEEFLEQQSTLDKDKNVDVAIVSLPPLAKVPLVDPLEEVAQELSRRGSVASARSVLTVNDVEIDPADELCGWGPFSPAFCQGFRNPKWVLVWLSLAGMCQVSERS